MDKISVLGGGSWGTTLANLLAAKDLNVSIWARDPKKIGRASCRERV